MPVIFLAKLLKTTASVRRAIVCFDQLWKPHDSKACCKMSSYVQHPFSGLGCGPDKFTTCVYDDMYISQFSKFGNMSYIHLPYFQVTEPLRIDP